MSVDSLNWGTARTIQSVSALPTSGTQNFQRHTMFKLPDGSVYRLINTVFNRTPTNDDFELLVPVSSPTIPQTAYFMPSTYTAAAATTIPIQSPSSSYVHSGVQVGSVSGNVLSLGPGKYSIRVISRITANGGTSANPASARLNITHDIAAGAVAYVSDEASSGTLITGPRSTRCQSGAAGAAIPSEINIADEFFVVVTSGTYRLSFTGEVWVGNALNSNQSSWRGQMYVTQLG